MPDADDVDNFDLMDLMVKNSVSIILLWLLIAPVSLACASGMDSLALSSNDGIRVAPTSGESAERFLPTDRKFSKWILDSSIFDEDQGDRTEIRQVAETDIKTIKLANLIPPVHFQEGDAGIPEEYLKRLREILDGMRGRENVRLHFVGHADSLQLSDQLTALYGDNLGLSRERAGITAEYCQQALDLPPQSISYEGLGDRVPVASNTDETGRALNRRVEVEVWYDEIGEKIVEKEVFVPRNINRIKLCRSETVCKLTYMDGHAHRARVKNLISAFHYDDGMLTVPDDFLSQVSQARQNLSGKENVVVKFIAYTDSVPLSGRQKRIYGNHLGLSKAVARRVALAVQDALGLTSTEIESEGSGATRPAASNDTPRGRALNRRVEVEFWHDDPLQELSDEPQICPDAAGAETVSRIYHSPTGGVPPILFRDGDPVVPPQTIGRLQRLMAETGDKANVRLSFVGYTRNQRLSRRVAKVYGDDIGWSTARARRAMLEVVEQMGLTEKQAEFEGRGYVQSEDVINAGFVESDISRVEVQAVYDELVTLDDYQGVEINRLTREVSTADPFALNLMRISVDGSPVDDPRKSIPDVQRCTDIALERAQVQFKHDSLKLRPRLNVSAWPRTISYQDVEETEFVENLVSFRLYSNYRSFIDRAEVRIFEDEQSVRDTPMGLLELDENGLGNWQYSMDAYPAPGSALKYLVRVYDEDGRFDETIPQPLWLVDQIDPVVAMANVDVELLAGYGESRISRRNIPLRGGTVHVLGRTIPTDHEVWLAGYGVPVDGEGSFVAEEILPDGLHTVEVAVLDESGNGELFLRDLSLDRSDWFNVGIADLTLSANETNGPAKLLSENKPQYSDDINLQGRMAFYSKGKFASGWGLTASADTREGPLDDIFSNFLDKDPEALFRRIDPDVHYPTFGDDSTVMEDAPTMGKFYVRLKKDHNFGLWGNFNVGYLENSLAHVDRGLYGLNLHYQTQSTTGFGEQRFVADGFAADPGTVPGRDDFRGTGGSLYYLQRQDLLEGSDRLRIEIRDKDSGLVLGVKNLTPVLDYDIDYLQGRVLLSLPLSSIADDGLLVQNGSFSGNPVFLVARYEFTPGLDDPDLLTTGGRVDYWLNDHVKVGVTASKNKESGETGTLNATDVTLRKTAQSWLKLEAGRSDGPGVPESFSDDGGYNFETFADLENSGESAMGYRAEMSLGFGDVLANGKGHLTLYGQELEAGYSAPGLLTETDRTQYGGTVDFPVSSRFNVRVKGEKNIQEDALETESAEIDVDYQASLNWSLSAGVRHDNREDNSAEVPSTQDEGKRTDAVMQLSYDSRARWSAFGFLQESLETTGNRDDNARIGAGGSYRLTDRFKVDGELSDGDLGTGGRLGTEYLYSDRSTLYLNYSYENERTDNGLRARKGNLTSGFRTRYSDSASVYLEERYDYGDVPTGLMHSTGVELAPSDRLNLSANVDFGTLKDNRNGAETKRTAAALSAGYGFDQYKIVSAVEYRVDDSEEADSSNSKRTTWLFKNNFKYKTTPSWNLIGKFNYSHSDSSMGKTYDGKYIEAVLGYAYRPVENDRLNALIKYTYFYDIPSSDQIDPSGQTSSGVLQKSHIAAVDVMYELTAQWTVGGKYAYRNGKVSLDRVNREFFSSRANLYVLRADWHFVHRWDALIEGRVLDLPDAEDRRSGVLLGLYRHMGNHIKLGVGYNFSDFSDDLTNMDYDHQGLFVNLIGKY